LGTQSENFDSETQVFRTVEVVAHDTVWSERFRAEAAQLARLFEPEVIAIHHIGSTAIPSIKAKPIIDLLVEVYDIARIDDYNSAMTSVGYQPKGELGIRGRRYFSKDIAGVRSHHVHAFERGDPEIERHILFVDFLIAHPDQAQAYSELKEKLAVRYPTDPHAYNEAKTEFIQEIDKQAAAWRANHSGVDRRSRIFLLFKE
jgi:GrpB-like predicted nucleotidyltransferase (UPF0157 family)